MSLKIILGRYGMSNCRPAKILISSEITNSLIIYEDQVEKSTIGWDQSVIKALM